MTGFLIARRDQTLAWCLSGDCTLADAVAEAGAWLGLREAEDRPPGDLVIWKRDKVEAVVRLVDGEVDVRCLVDPVAASGDTT